MPIYEYRCGNCGERVEVLIRPSAALRQGSGHRPSTGSGHRSDSGAPSCPQCGSPLLEKLFSAPNVISRWGQPSGGGTCCGREERCAAPPCSTGETCRRDY
jgi:predicted nucleic acid-binding Zn ribbon protein